MSATDKRSPLDAPSLTPPEVEVLNWPLVQDGWRSVFYLLLTIACISLLFYLSGSAACALLGCLAILISLWRFWLPVRFQLSPLGIVQTCLGRQRFIAWSNVRRCERLQSGILFFFSTDRSPLALLSTLYISWRDQQNPFLELIDNCTEGEHLSQRSTSRQS